METLAQRFFFGEKKVWQSLLLSPLALIFTNKQSKILPFLLLGPFCEGYTCQTHWLESGRDWWNGHKKRTLFCRGPNWRLRNFFWEKKKMTRRFGGKVQEKDQLFSRRLANLDKKLISVSIWQNWQRWQSWQSLTVDAGTWNKSSLSLSCITPPQRCIVLKRTHTHLPQTPTESETHTRVPRFYFSKDGSHLFPGFALV